MRPRRFRRPRVPRVSRAVVLLPNGFTLFNLFCGIFAIVLASRARFGTAALFVVVGGVADAFDGRVARATGTGSRFGEELDSLVDAISFGLAPALIMYFAVLNREGWDWIFVFFFTACAVMRLARFNVEQAGRAKTHFHGLPSPAAGMTLAMYYPFSQTRLYNETVIFFTDHTTLADFPWYVILRWLMVLLACLMISNVPYPAVPTIGYRNVRQIAGTAIVLGSVLGLIFLPREFIFPALIAYVLFGALQWVLLGFLDRVPRPGRSIYWADEEADAAGSEDEEERGAEVAVATPAPRAGTPVATPAVAAIAGGMAALDGAESHARRRRRRRRHRGDRPDGADRPDHIDRGERDAAPRPNPFDGEDRSQ